MEAPNLSDFVLEVVMPGTVPPATVTGWKRCRTSIERRAGWGSPWGVGGRLRLKVRC